MLKLVKINIFFKVVLTVAVDTFADNFYLYKQNILINNFRKSIKEQFKHL